MSNGSLTASLVAEQLFFLSPDCCSSLNTGTDGQTDKRTDRRTGSKLKGRKDEQAVAAGYKGSPVMGECTQDVVSGGGDGGDDDKDDDVPLRELSLLS